ncbi:MAG: formylglycine-generating enzyme family protein, partial [Pirellulaceae bacterium]|nr:formylglycine-generating enzyme family protein [Pirellulaceae bacterium]
RLLSTLFLAAIVLSPASPFAAAAPVPGLVADQPTSGRFVKTDQGYMVPYKQTIPGTEVVFEMQPIPGGKFLLGSPAGEKGRQPSEGPQIEITVEPFWMGSHEITWAEYKSYMRMNDAFRKLKAADLLPITDANKPLIVTAPSNLYDPTFTFKQGADPKQPAVTMSQFAAKQYTKWLSGITGQIYRLPGEAEWEYACRAGTSTAYFFGDDPAPLGDYAWYYDNGGETTHLVGQKKPSPWGLYDIHGNVGEWTLDEFTKAGYERLAGKTVSATEAINWPTKLYPRVVRGGGWDEDADKLRSSARRPSDDDDWRAEDPNFPQSPWWFTSEPALSVGFRLLRPLAEPAAAAKQRYWEADLEQIQTDADMRIDNEGRGARGVANPELPEAIKKLPQ